MKLAFLLLSLSAALTAPASAQSSCNSEGQTPPTVLVEHFISADCETCWGAPPTQALAAEALRLDWIVPGGRGDEAPLSAAAIPDARLRLKTLERTPPLTSLIARSAVVTSPALTLRVAHGVALGGYIGTSIELHLADPASASDKLSVWLVLVESIPAGTDGTQTERNLVRNAFVGHWRRAAPSDAAPGSDYRELRPMRIPSGATPRRLRVVGWVQDERGRLLAAAQSVCSGSD